MADLSPRIEWTGAKMKRGYGNTRHEGRQICAHRLAYIKANGLTRADIDGKLIRHRCDNPSCVNPDHLVIGSALDNVRDMFDRGRQVILKGEKQIPAKLSDAAVRDIRARLAAGERQKDLAAEYGVDASIVSRVASRIMWAHVL